MKVMLLRYSNSAIKGMTHEVREDRLLGFGVFFGSKQECLQWMADRGAECTNLSEWGEQKLPDARLLPL